MSLFQKTKPLFLFAVLAAGLTACDSMKVWRAEVPEPCPRITVLGDASDMTRFQDGAGQDLIDILYEAEMVNVFSACRYDVDYETRAGLIDIRLAPQIAAKRGPANRDRSATIPYFVAVLDSDRTILDKNVFELRLAFPGNLTQNTVRDEPIDLEINTDGSTDGSDYEIYVGFQLSEEEVAYNRRLRERR